MYTVELCRQAKIGTVIHDQCYPIPPPNRMWVPWCSLMFRDVETLSQGPKKSLNFPCMLQHHPRTPRFIPVLNEGASCHREFLSGRQHRTGIGEETGIK